MRTRNVLGVIIAIVAGAILIYYGIWPDAGLGPYIELLWTLLSLPMEYLPYVMLANTVFDFIASGGGITVIGGAILVALGWEGWGRYLIKLGTGLSILSLLWRLAVFALPLASLPIEDLLIHVGFFLLGLFTSEPVGIALLLSIIAQNLIVKVPRSVNRAEKEARRAQK